MELDILVVVLLDELVLVNALVLRAVHSLEEACDDFFKAITKVVNFLLVHGTALQTLLVRSESEHVLNELFFVDDAILVSVDLIKLFVQVQSYLLVVSLSFDSIRAVNVDIVEVGSGRTRVAN